MRSTVCVGRVGGLAVALGIGVAVATGYGCGVAWADTPGSSATESSTTKPDDEDSTTKTTEPATDPDVESTTAPTAPAKDRKTTTPTKTAKPKPATKPVKKAKAPVTKVDAAEVKSDNDAKPSPASADADTPVSSVAAQMMSSAPEPKPAQLKTAALTTPITTPKVPSLRPWPTAYDPTTVVTYVGGLVSSLVKAVLDPFAAGPPAAPSGPPTVWTLLA